MKTLALLFLLMPAVAAQGDRIVRTSMGGNIRVDAAPEGAVLHTMGGNIRVTQAAGKVVARTMGGNIRLRGLEGSVEAATVGGSIDLDVTGAGKGRMIEVHATGGDIDMTFPADFGGDFEIELVQDDHGPVHGIVSDFPLQIDRSTDRRWLRRVDVVTASGRIGSGGNRVRITGIGGRITIRKQ